MLPSDEGARFELLIRKIEPRSTLLRSWSLAGGVSAQVTALEIALPDGTIRKLIVRRHGDAGIQQNPYRVADEARLLRTLLRAGLSAPVPLYVDQAGEVFATPCLVFDYIDGEPEFAPVDPTHVAGELAAYLAQIHRVDLSTADLAFLPRQGSGFGTRPARLDDSLQEGLIRDAMESLWPLSRLNDPVLLHGDFWPGNVLWEDRQIAAVIDWEDARLGDPLVDVGNSRLEILWAYGLPSMHMFTQRYKSLMPAVDFADLPYWDLCAALRPASVLAEWGLSPSTEAAMRERHRVFVAQALGASCAP